MKCVATLVAIVAGAALVADADARKAFRHGSKVGGFVQCHLSNGKTASEHVQTGACCGVAFPTYDGATGIAFTGASGGKKDCPSDKLTEETQADTRICCVTVNNQYDPKSQGWTDKASYEENPEATMMRAVNACGERYERCNKGAPASPAFGSITIQYAWVPTAADCENKVTNFQSLGMHAFRGEAKEREFFGYEVKAKQTSFAKWCDTGDGRVEAPAFTIGPDGADPNYYNPEGKLLKIIKQKEDAEARKAERERAAKQKADRKVCCVTVNNQWDPRSQGWTGEADYRKNIQSTMMRSVNACGDLEKSDKCNPDGVAKGTFGTIFVKYEWKPNADCTNEMTSFKSWGKRAFRNSEREFFGYELTAQQSDYADWCDTGDGRVEAPAFTPGPNGADSRYYDAEGKLLRKSV